MSRIGIDVPQRRLNRTIASQGGDERRQAASQFQQLISLMGQMASRGKSVLTELLPAQASPRAYRHYPDGSAHDPATGYRWFYHCHPRSRRSVPCEHGHFHLFADLRQSVRTTHLMAISVDAKGLPIGLFLPNLWVTEDQSQQWHEIAELAGRFSTRCAAQPLSIQLWLEHAAQCFWLALPALWSHRQDRLDALQATSAGSVTQNRRIEVLSRCRIELTDWAEMLQAPANGRIR